MAPTGTRSEAAAAGHPGEKPAASAPPEPRAWRVAIAFLLCGAAVFALSRTVADPDLWGHVLFGLLILDEGLPRTDPFSYLTGEHPWINHEWLSEVAFGWTYRLGGDPGLVVLKTGIALLLVWLLYGALRRSGVQPARSATLIVLLFFLLLPFTAVLRPQLFTFLFFLLTLLILTEAEREGRRRLLLLLPPLMAVWVNFHGGVLAGLGVLVIWSLVSAGDGAYRGLRGLSSGPGVHPGPAIAVTVAAAMATLANPYGPELPLFLLRTATGARPDITEWQPLAVRSPVGIAFLVVLGVGIATLARSRLPRRPPFMALLAVLAILPLTAGRHLALFGLGFVPLLAPHLADTWEASADADAAPRTTARLRIPAMLLTALAGTVMLVASVPRFRCLPIDARHTLAFPARAVALLQQAGVEGNLAVHFDWGEYAIWHLAPRVRVSMDGRRETVYPDSVYEEYLRFQNGVGAWDAVLERHPTDLALVPTEGPTFNLLSLKPGWSPVYVDSLAAIFAPESSPLRTALDPAGAAAVPIDGEGSCMGEPAGGHRDSRSGAVPGRRSDV